LNALHIKNMPNCITSQFHDFLNLIFGGVLLFGPTAAAAEEAAQG
jgi:hypothetical protein